MTRSTVASERITYLIANYNHGSLIGECLRSLHGQTTDRWRALIGDDASTDASRKVMAPYLDDERIHLIVNRTNIGKVCTLRMLLNESETDIVGILDPDDTLAPAATERVLDAYTGNPGTIFVYTRFLAYDATLSTPLGLGGHEIPAGQTALQVGGIGALLTFRRVAYRQTAGLDAEILYAEDRDLVYKLEEVARPVFVDEALYNYRQLPHSQSNDPEKREIGLRNHLRARFAALRRRRIDGPRGLFWRIVFACEYLQSSRRFRWPTGRLATFVRNVLGRLEGVAGSPRAR